MPGLTQKYLEGLRDVLGDLLVAESFNVSCISVAPWILVVFIVANSKTLTAPLIAVAYSLGAYTVAFKGRLRREMCRLIRNTLYIMALTAIILLPLILWSPSVDVYSFVVRVVSSTVTFTAMVKVIGWRRILGFLRLLRVPPDVVNSLGYSVILIPIFISDTLKLLMAREARPGPKAGVWRRISTVASEAILRSYYRGHTLDLALKARTIHRDSNTPRSECEVKAGAFEFSLFLLAALILSLEVTAWLQV